jgi:hypothetical protein
MTRSWLKGVGILILTGLVAILVGLLYSKGSADFTGSDRQPMAFGHDLHAGRLSIDCRYCHRAAESSTVAGVPSLHLCMGCHRNLSTQSPSMAVLLDHWNRREPIRWVRLQQLPDFVYFTHERHLAHGLECTTCHGQVQQMSTTPRAPSLEMGWCLACHEQRNASRDCWTCHK